jgi:glutamate dehydrogenase/leucine dehydrogenase
MSTATTPTTPPAEGPEHLVTHRGERSDQLIIISLDSTRLGPALGGCRLRRYDHWLDGLGDAVRLSAAMTEKAALADLPYGGGKTVVALDPGFPATPGSRAGLLADIGDLVESLAGTYLTGPDMGTGPDDMAAIGERTGHVLCRPEAHGGSGDSSTATATGVLAAIDAVRAHRWPGRDLASLTFGLHGLGHVGAKVASALARAGARLVVADTDPGTRRLAERLGATWTAPQDLCTADVDVLVPNAVGGLLSAETVPRLRCSAVVGAANNQLATPDTADRLHHRGILWAPDTIVSAGGIIGAIAREREGLDPTQAARRVSLIGDRLAGILADAAARGTTPLAESRRRARLRLHDATPPSH